MEEEEFNYLIKDLPEEAVNLAMLSYDTEYLINSIQGTVKEDGSIQYSPEDRRTLKDALTSSYKQVNMFYELIHKYARYLDEEQLIEKSEQPALREYMNDFEKEINLFFSNFEKSVNILSEKKDRYLVSAYGLFYISKYASLVLDIIKRAKKKWYEAEGIDDIKQREPYINLTKDALNYRFRLLELASRKVLMTLNYPVYRDISVIHNIVDSIVSSYKRNIYDYIKDEYIVASYTNKFRSLETILLMAKDLSEGKKINDNYTKYSIYKYSSTTNNRQIYADLNKQVFALLQYIEKDPYASNVSLFPPEARAYLLSVPTLEQLERFWSYFVYFSIVSSGKEKFEMKTPLLSTVSPVKK